MNPARTETEREVNAIAQPLRWRYRTDDTDQWSFAHSADIAPPADKTTEHIPNHMK
jgi:hypothetical protein